MTRIHTARAAALALTPLRVAIMNNPRPSGNTVLHTVNALIWNKFRTMQNDTRQRVLSQKINLGLTAGLIWQHLAWRG